MLDLYGIQFTLLFFSLYIETPLYVHIKNTYYSTEKFLSAFPFWTRNAYS